MLGLAGGIKSITALIVAFVMHISVAGVIDETPEQAAKQFMDGLIGQETELTDMYMGNQYVNLIANLDMDGGMDQETAGRFRQALFANLSYEIAGIEERDPLAVVKLSVKGNDFSKVMEDYDKASYEYVTGNLYDDDVIDKEKLRKKCLDIYVQQLEKTAKESELRETTVYLPMEQDRNGVWRIRLSDEIMAQLRGDIALPDGVIEKEEDGKSGEE